MLPCLQPVNRGVLNHIVRSLNSLLPMELTYIMFVRFTLRRGKCTEEHFKGRFDLAVPAL